MAQRRMFAKTVVDSDAFLDMPQSSQALYFHLGMRADDDGFINNPKSIMRIVGSKDDDLKLLIAKKFIIPFANGVIVIKHWRIHNYIQNDRYTKTKYIKEREQLTLDENNAYTTIESPSCIQNTYNVDTQVRLGKVITNNSPNSDKSELAQAPLIEVPEIPKEDKRKPEIDYLIDLFKEKTGFPPIDNKPRFVAHNFHQKVCKIYKEANSKDFTFEGYQLLCDRFFDWYFNLYKNLSTQRLKTVTDKFNIFIVESKKGNK